MREKNSKPFFGFSKITFSDFYSPKGAFTKIVILVQKSHVFLDKIYELSNRKKFENNILSFFYGFYKNIFFFFLPFFKNQIPRDVSLFGRKSKIFRRYLKVLDGDEIWKNFLRYVSSYDFLKKKIWKKVSRSSSLVIWARSNFISPAGRAPRALSTW